MPESFITIFPLTLFAVVQSLLISWMTLKLICLAHQNFFGFLYISSGKSTTNARLLGGLAISAPLICSISTLLFFYPETINQLEHKTLMFAFFSIFIVTFYGYIDDKFEVRVRFKLALQFASILSFSYFYAPQLSAEHPTMAFVFSSILGLALVNGTNLLDGLDTLSVKLGSASALAFLYLGIISHNYTTVFLSVILISALTMFYFYNREPARIYMGEIGGSIIGLIYFIQSSITFSHLKTQMSMTQAFAMVLIAGCFPIFELGISFCRRIWCKKTPFRGDRLHLHYIIKNKYRLSASQVSTRMGLSSMLILAFAFVIAKNYNPILALSFVVILTFQIYLWVCLDEWRSLKIFDGSNNVLNIFEGKKVNIIDSTQYSSLDISLSEAKKNELKKRKRA